MKENATYHVPVLLTQSIQGLITDPSGTYIDLTFGGGGHSSEILRQLNANGHLFGFDQDADAERNNLTDSRFTFVRSNFRYLTNFMRYYGVEHVDGILADLGVSWHHFDDAQRGFSFRFEDGNLDMRMNCKARIKASDILNQYDEDNLSRLFHLYGELKTSKKLAAAIIKARCNTPFQTVAQLLATIRPIIGKEHEKKETAKVFQALRIEVNHELEALQEMLEQTTDLLNPGGRLAIITYHSIEDRMVKNLMKSGNIRGRIVQDFYGNIECPFKTITKVIVPTDEEINQNPRARSAKLRIAEKR